jgi:type VI secretion system secreted protein VgrG
MASLKQTDRLMQFSSTLGKDVLLIESLDGAEGISRLFEYQLELLATVDTEIDPKSIVGTKVAIAVALSDVQGSRWINGIVASFEQRAGDTEFNVYRARIVPSMWQLTLSSNCRVFQQKTVLDIAKAVFSEYGLSVSDQTSETYKPLDYCTQYSESDFNFVQRILEESGIFYWFEHSDQDNKILLGDGRTAYQDCPLSASFPYALNEKGREGAYGARVTDFTSAATMVSGKHSTAEYNFRTYTRLDIPDKNSVSPFGENGYSEYLYPAGEEGYLKDADTQLSTQMETLFLGTRTGAADALAEVFRGEANARSLCAGYTFSLTGHLRDGWNRKYLLTEVIHHADQVPPYRTSNTQKKAEFNNNFTAISSDLIFKPPLTIEKPRIFGPQTAVVVAPAGEEMYIDKYGRVNVQFFWDKLRKANTVDSTWVRVAQQWAGNGWGSYFWPRLKDEVVVQFLNGDPDNPIVTGSVYNGVNLPKYQLPGNSTRSGLYTRSSKGGSASNANEIRFEDKTGSEEIFINAEKDLTLHVEHDWHTQIDNEQHTTVTKDRYEEVDGDTHLTVKGKQFESVAGDTHLNISGKHIVQVGGDHSETVSGDRKESIGGNQHNSVGSNLNEQVGSNYSLTVGQNQVISAGMNFDITASMGICLTVGSNTIVMSPEGIGLNGMGGFISIGPSGVTISGMMVMINSGGAPVSGSPGNAQSPQSPDSPTAPTAPTYPGDDQPSGGAAAAAGDDAADGAADAGAAAGGAAGAAADAADSAAGGLAAGAAALGGAASAAAGAAEGAVNQAEQAAQQAVSQVQQAAQQAVSQAQQLAQQVAQQAQQAANQAKQAVQQAEQQAQQAVDGVVQQARQAYQQAQGAVQQAQQQVQQAAAQGQAAAQQALNQAQQQVQQCAQAASNAVQQAQQQADQIKQQAQQAANQAQQAAQGAVNQAQQAVQQAQQQAQQAVQQAQQQAQQAVQQGQQAVQGAEQQAQQAAQQAQQQVQQAANQAQQAAQQATQQAQQAAQQAQQQAQQAAQQVQQSASQSLQQAQQASQGAQQSAQQAMNQAQRGF